MSLSLAFNMTMTFALPTLVTVALILAYYYISTVLPKRRLLDKIPAKFPCLPLVGSSPYLKTGPNFRKQLYDICLHKNGPAGICLVWLAWHPVVLIWKAEYVEVLLGGHEIKKSYLYNFVKPWLGEGLLTSHGDHWYKHRKLLTPAFHFRILNDFVPIMNEHAENLVQMLEKHADDGTEVDVFPLITLTTLNVICEAAMGQTTGEEERKIRSRVFNAVIDLSHAIACRLTQPLVWPSLIYALTSSGRKSQADLKIIKDYTDKIFSERAKSFDREAVKALMTTSTGQRRPLPFLDALLYASDNFSKLSKQDIIDEVNTFLFTGHDTTAASTTWTIYLLARHPEVQKKLHEELDAIFGSSNRPVTVEDIKEMRYLAACLKESLRLFPVAPVYGREMKSTIKFGDYIVPANSTIFVLNEFLHRDPKYFEEPLKFKPERFSTDKDVDEEDMDGGVKSHPFAYVPFSAGQRNCIGQKYAQVEDKILIASVLRRFTLECDYSEDDLAPAVDVILRPTKGVPVRFHYR